MTGAVQAPLAAWLSAARRAAASACDAALRPTRPPRGQQVRHAGAVAGGRNTYEPGPDMGPPPTGPFRGPSGELLAHRGQRPILLPSSVKVAYDTEQVPRRQQFQFCRRLLFSGPKGVFPVYVPPFVRLWLEEAEKEATLTSPAGAAAKDDPNNLGDPTALGENTRQLWMRAEDIESSGQYTAWVRVHYLASQAVTGVTEGFTVPVRLNGVGYRVAIVEPTKSGDRPVLSCKLGYPNSFDFPIPEDMQITIYNPTNFVLCGPNKKNLLDFAMAIRACRKPEPYKLKGVFVNGETIKKKEPKKGKRGG
ncbi:MAG: ribosomal protein L6, alpha-beta domain-containing protein [Olpidium bornovanus]|uniref:Ribosomal protein L6, alpha-beta domain-containing protein n=1 Tax=Olpidium bornovanus TaxID=278681 RepID=A0A8H7ZU13_9FUNG|nr:MAG: ribosomal protein L6, alpha-beta domain-containing protein [Olpidium bornovanus]